MKVLQNLIETCECWLCQRVLDHARAQDFTTDSSTLELPWRAAISGFSELMAGMLAQNHWPAEISRESNSKLNVLNEFAEKEVRLHRQRGVPLSQFIGLIKYYRRTYLDMIEQHFASDAKAGRYEEFINFFFDNTEISICAEWEKQHGSVALRQAAETNRQLINEKNRYLTIFESLSEPVIIVNDAGRVSNFNLAAHLLFNDQAISGQGYYDDVKNARLQQQVTALIRHAGNKLQFEHPLETERGKRTFQVKIQRMLDVSEKFIGTVIILSDVTDFHKAQRASEAASRAKNAFLATMSHEIRTPINGILGIGQLLHEAPLCDVQRSYVDALLSSGELLRDLVNDVLDYSKLEAGESGLQPVVFSPRELVERVVQVSLGETERKGLKLIVDVSKDCPQAVEADSGKIQRILLNLINNAVKFTEYGSVSVVVSGTENSLSFTIRDTGPGIPEVDHGRVFEAFVQRPANASVPPAGTGLGLAICSKLSDLLGASLTLERPDDGGALFRLDCPVRVIDTDTLNSGEAPQESAILDVLLVEDNVVNTMVIEGFLESDGHRVDCVASGEAALERLDERLYDLVLMDIRLQGADGFAIIKQIRASDDPRVAALPILVLTADQSDESIRKFARSGANAFLAKPFSHEDLRRAVGRAFILSANLPANGHKKPMRNAPVLDISVILKHRDAIGHERTDSILEAFCETALQHKSALRAAAGGDDSRGVADIAHTLHSAAQMIGLVQLGHSAKMIERRLVAGHQPINLVSESEVLCQQIDDGLAALSTARVPS